ncbi:MAG: peptidoglycan DD-metalloendopeptidase family protein [Burkholderiales bacterium]
MTKIRSLSVAILADAIRRTGELMGRHWLIPMAVAVSFFAVVTAFGTVDEQTSDITTASVVEPVRIRVSSVDDSSLSTFRFEERFARGDTIAAVLSRLHVSASDVAAVLADKAALSTLNALRPGIVVEAEVDDSGRLASLRFITGNSRLAGLNRTASGFSVVDQAITLRTQVHARAGVVGSSFFGSADAVGVPDSIAMRLAEVLGAEIDFHRDFRRGDRFTVVFETLHHDGRLIRTGRLLAAEVVRGGQAHRAVWFEHGDTHGYFTPDGKSLRHAFLRSPLEFTRITSGFEQRYLPGSKRWQTHKGIDYAAPIGTPVRATGDGVVDFIGTQAGYGSVVILSHKGGVTTLYAHLSGFADELKEGRRVAQAELIGYVGKTGWATGPHLHYEYQLRGQHVDPLSMALPSSTPIPGELAARFQSQTSAVVARLDFLRSSILASAE